MDCYYRFRSEIPAEKARLSITLHNQYQKVFAAVFKGNKQTINDKTILQLAVSFPLQTFKVVAAIHWEALKIWLKGIRLYRHNPAKKAFSWSKGKCISSIKIKADRELSE